jgi:ankyrin repeat protein
VLLDQDAEVDRSGRFGNAPLWTAVFNSRGRGDVIALLQERGADPFNVNTSGQTPVGLTRLIGNYDVAQCFSDLPAQPPLSATAEGESSSEQSGGMGEGEPAGEAGQEAERDWLAGIEEAQRQPTYVIGGREYPRVRYGEEALDWGADSGSCHDCAVVKGQWHVPGCAVERCPRCGGQVISCDCEYEGDDEDA